MEMKNVLKFIEEHIEEPLTNKQLARVANYSEYHFIRLFKLYTGMTSMKYVMRRKLIKAYEDIINGEKIIDVADKYGWSSQSSFTNSFHREFGFSPSLLRAIRFQVDYIGDGNMNNVFLNCVPIGISKEKLLELLKVSIKNNRILLDEKLLDEVYQVACKVYDGVKRYSGEEYITHTINVAIILAELGATEDIILAGLICDINEKGKVPLKEIKKELPKQIVNIVSRLKNKALSSEDEEVVLIKLAERLHNMRTIDYIDDLKKKERVEESFKIYLPLAKKVNNVKLIDELNDLIMKFQ